MTIKEAIEILKDLRIYDDDCETDVEALTIAIDTLEKLEEGKLIELPCKVGDTVYVLEYEDDCAVDYSGYIFIMANNDFAFLSPIINGERNPIEICNEFFNRYINVEDNSGIIVPLSELYLTKEEAEKKLEELKNAD